MLSVDASTFAKTPLPSVRYGVAVLISCLVKLWLAGLGDNYDLQSYQLVADAVWNHKIVYSATHRYNYGPLWAYTLAGLHWVQQLVAPHSGLTGLHIAVTALLAGIDVAIGEWLRRTYSRKAAIVFLLNPVVWLITGFHAQFDNVAILFALMAWSILRKGQFSQRSSLLMGGWLGLSLITKHLMLFFLVWIFFDRRITLSNRLLIMGVAIGLFVSSFFPFLLWNSHCWPHIWQRVITYRSNPDLSVLTYVIRLFAGNMPVHFVFFGVLSGAGYWFNRHKNYLLIYLSTLVALSTAMADQYLVIPAIACACYSTNGWVRYYTVAVLFTLLARSAANVGSLLPGKPWLDAWLSGLPPLVDTFIAYGIPQLLLVGFVCQQLYQLMEPSRLKQTYPIHLETA